MQNRCQMFKPLNFGQRLPEVKRRGEARSKLMLDKCLYQQIKWNHYGISFLQCCQEIFRIGSNIVTLRDTNAMITLERLSAHFGARGHAMEVEMFSTFMAYPRVPKSGWKVLWMLFLAHALSSWLLLRGRNCCTGESHICKVCCQFT